MGGRVNVTAGLRSCGLFQLETSHGVGGCPCGFQKSVKWEWKLWRKSGESVSQVPQYALLKFGFFPHNWIVS